MNPEIIPQNEAGAMLSIKIVVPGEAAPNRRKFRIARSSKTGKSFVQDYKAAGVQTYQDTVRSIATAAMAGREPLQGPVRLRYRVFITMPKSMPKYQQREVFAGLRFPIRKPDLDNTLKTTLDGIKQVVMADDHQVVRLSDDSGRYYGRHARIEIEVEPVTHCALQAAEFGEACQPRPAADLFAGEAA